MKIAGELLNISTRDIQALELLNDHVHDVRLRASRRPPLDLAFGEQDRGARRGEPKFLEDAPPEDEVRKACLVFQSDEDDAARGAGPLTTDDDPRDAYCDAITIQPAVDEFERLLAPSS